VTDIYVTTMHGDDQGADDARQRGDALLIRDDRGADPGYVLRWDGREELIDATDEAAALLEARRHLDGR